MLPAAASSPPLHRFLSTNTAPSNTWTSINFADSSWVTGKARFGYGAGMTWNTALVGTSTSLKHYFRTKFCLSAARHAWLDQQQLLLKVMADNGADVYINGVRLLADASANHNPQYWNDIVAVPGNHTAFVNGLNTIAVLVTNTAETTSDAGFDLDLAYSAPQASLEVPDPVTGSATGGTGSITLKWTKPVCEGSSFVTQYNITLTSTATNQGTGTTVVLVTDPFVSAYSRTFSSLKAKTRYTLSVVAVNAAGASSVLQASATTK